MELETEFRRRQSVMRNKVKKILVSLFCIMLDCSETICLVRPQSFQCFFKG